MYNLTIVGNGGQVTVKGVDLDTMDKTVRAYGSSKNFEIRTPDGCLYIKPQNCFALKVVNVEEDDK